MSETVPSTTLEGRVKTLLTPRGFFVGVAVGFVTCCVAGRQLPKLLPMQGMARLHSYLNPQTLYFPTALQIRALARHELPRDKIAVIVSGNSIMQGGGQSDQNIWTKHLQQELGEEYRVLNLAVPSGAPNEFGQIAAEMLCASGRRVLHVCNCNPTFYAASPDGTKPIYRYIFHDAKARGLLLPYPERDAALAALEPKRVVEQAHEELLLQVQANRWLSFNDLWHVVAYEACFTLWTKSCLHQQWRARKHVPDGGNAPRNQRDFAHWAQARRLLISHATPYAAEEWQWYARCVRQSVPEALRPRTLAVINRYNPRYVAKMALEEPDFPARYHEKMHQALEQIRGCGVRAVEAGGQMDPSDFADLQHLLASGGVKLARELAPAIRTLARDLGYVEGERP